MTQECINEYRVMFSCKLVLLAEKYDSMLCMSIDASSTLALLTYVRNLLTILCIIQDSTCYDITKSEKVVLEISTVLK
jgi:uncharacterized membrane protein